MRNIEITESSLFTEFCSWIKAEKLRITDISYGSGGYCISILNMRLGKVYTKYSWDVTDALMKIKNEMMKDSAPIQKDYDITLSEDDRKTDPDIKS